MLCSCCCFMIRGTHSVQPKKSRNLEICSVLQSFADRSCIGAAAEGEVFKSGRRQRHAIRWTRRCQNRTGAIQFSSVSRFNIIWSQFDIFSQRLIVKYIEWRATSREGPKYGGSNGFFILPTRSHTWLQLAKSGIYELRTNGNLVCEPSSFS